MQSESTEQEFTIDLHDVLDILKKHLFFILSSFFICAMIGLALSVFILPKKYTSDVSLYVNNTDSVKKDGVNFGDLQASQKLVETYKVILEDDTVVEQVARELSRPVSIKDLKKMVKIESVNQTEVLSVKAETDNAAFSAEVCNTVAKIAPEVLKRVVGAGSVEVIGEAKPARQPSSPNMAKDIGFGGIIGLVGSLLISFIVAILDKTIKSEEDLKNRFDVPVLGEIPSFAVSTKRGKKGA